MKLLTIISIFLLSIQFQCIGQKINLSSTEKEKVVLIFRNTGDSENFSVAKFDNDSVSFGVCTSPKDSIVAFDTCVSIAANVHLNSVFELGYSDWSKINNIYLESCPESEHLSKFIIHSRENEENWWIEIIETSCNQPAYQTQLNALFSVFNNYQTK